jgi:hypothetical protein
MMTIVWLGTLDTGVIERPHKFLGPWLNQTKVRAAINACLREVSRVVLEE